MAEEDDGDSYLIRRMSLQSQSGTYQIVREKLQRRIADAAPLPPAPTLQGVHLAGITKYKVVTWGLASSLGPRTTPNQDTDANRYELVTGPASQDGLSSSSEPDGPYSIILDHQA